MRFICNPLFAVFSIHNGDAHNRNILILVYCDRFLHLCEIYAFSLKIWYTHTHKISLAVFLLSYQISPQVLPTILKIYSPSTPTVYPYFLSSGFSILSTDKH